MIQVKKRLSQKAWIIRSCDTQSIIVTQLAGQKAVSGAPCQVNSAIGFIDDRSFGTCVEFNPRENCLSVFQSKIVRSHQIVFMVRRYIKAELDKIMYPVLVALLRLQQGQIQKAAPVDPVVGQF